MESPPPPGAPASLPPPPLAMDAPLQDAPSPFSWDWSDLLDFNIDDQLNGSLEFDQSPVDPEPDPPPPPPSSTPGRVRKRDPRLICSNFLAGRVPCACPELDAKLEEEQQGLPAKKRNRTASASGKTRCQVIGCEADISQLKGYHRRHRVCLHCANASAVVIDGERKRYCQQCGKFHFLSDFDEGKRSCRRKLARHNNRRRRKPLESVVNREGESQGLGSSDDVACDDDNSKGVLGGTNSIAEGETSQESEEQIPILCSNPVADTIPNESVVTLVESGGTQINGERDESKSGCSLSYNDNKIAYSSPCPTGRISFKLYDWNPAEFPRRLRHQIFQWLASMPVELEGYIRPGCTIFTVFVAMPDFMWLKLLEEPVMHIRDFVADPGKMLSGRGPLLVYLDSVIFRAMRDGTSVMQVKVKEESPQLHYVHPTCFEAGKPMKFMVRGSNLLQPKFRFLVSFEGRYLAYNCCLPPRCGDSGRITGHSEHQILEIYIPRTELDHFGPAFIEVENESGISNFIPILIGSKEVCSEMRILEARFEDPCCSKGMASRSVCDSSEVSVLRQASFSQFMLDAGWLLKKVEVEDIKHKLSLSQVRRFNQLLTFLIENKSANLLERILHHIETVMDRIKLNNIDTDVTEADMNLLLSNIDSARDLLSQRHEDKVGSVHNSKSLMHKGGDWLYGGSEIEGITCSDSFVDEVKLQEDTTETAERGEIVVSVAGGSCTMIEDDNRPLLNREEVVMSIAREELPRKSCGRVIRNNRHAVTSRHLMFAVASLAVCLCVCVVFLHPQKVGKIATTVTRCLLN